MIKKLKILVILTKKKFLELFMRKNWGKNQKEFKVGKVIKRKGDNLYVKLKG